ncbi:phage-related modification methylase [Bartonella vinsonii subsp. berkhoffii str. Tweed]|uniref:site-specific DNA-methyltransferase (adenine-specific) n=2 Tax=Bartonella vinsonii TaxID=33047 RepID=N6VNB5_BARVB|nr:DNA adenine methylase [Bartonella vinsonii]ENN94671.1 phage-related modification methylase [Bartonella vinsonii subsp. berkhoffii str. Tweed]
MDTLYKETLKSIDPIEPAAAYVGGKIKLAKTIIKIIEGIPHRTYAEPFVGMGGIFFRRKLIPLYEVINDCSGDVVNFFRVLQRHYHPFMDLLEFQISSREAFQRFTLQDPKTLTDLERALRFLYLQRLSFGGQVAKRSFGINPYRGARFNSFKLEGFLKLIYRRLSNVTIEHLDWFDFIRRYDRSTTLFYLDPPYFGVENCYGKDLFKREDYQKMSTLLAQLKGKFVLSLNDVPEIRKTFSQFKLKEVNTSYTCGSNNPMLAQELIISNCDL